MCCFPKACWEDLLLHKAAKEQCPGMYTLEALTTLRQLCDKPRQVARRAEVHNNSKRRLAGHSTRSSIYRSLFQPPISLQTPFRHPSEFTNAGGLPAAGAKCVPSLTPSVRRNTTVHGRLSARALETPRNRGESRAGARDAGEADPNARDGG